MLIQLKNQGGGIGRVQIMVNGKEWLYDARPDGQRDADKEQLSITLNMNNCPYLVPGTENIVTVKAYNKAGWLYSRPVVKHFYPSVDIAGKPQIYIISIGINEYYLDDLDLKFAEKDALAMARAITLGAQDLFGKENTHLFLLTSPPEGLKETEADTLLLPTKENILNVLSAIAQRSKPTDVLFLYMAGHGTTKSDNDNPQFYYIAQNAYS